MAGEIPQYVIDAGYDAVEIFEELEPPISPSELDELDWYSVNHGHDGVRATLAFLLVGREVVPDPSYPTINSALNPGMPTFTEEELATIPPFTAEEKTDMKVHAERSIEEARARLKFWQDHGLHNPTQAARYLETLREEQSEEAAAAFEEQLYGHRMTPEAVAQQRAETAEDNRRHAAKRQREWQALSLEEKRVRQARGRMALYHMAQGTIDEYFAVESAKNENLSRE